MKAQPNGYNSITPPATVGDDEKPGDAQFVIMLKRVAVSLISCAVFLGAAPAANGAVIKPGTAAAKTKTSLPPPIEGKPFGFFDIEAQKFELGGKVVRVEITGRILGSEPIGGDMVRAMVKDTADRYGQVEFPRAGLEKLGLGRSYAGKAVSLYLLITPQGKEPAAKSTAVGSKFSRDGKGGGKYEW